MEEDCPKNNFSKYMFCKKCGNEIKNSASFCVKCGTKISVFADNDLSQAHFYSEDWTRKKVFAIASLPYFDVMIDDSYVYFIRLPKYTSATVGLIVGLLLFNILGAFVGSMIGSSNDAKKRKKYREAWIDSGQKIISKNFEKDVYFKILISKAKELLTLEKHRITVLYGDKTIVLQKNKKEVERLNNYLKDYVL